MSETTEQKQLPDRKKKFQILNNEYEVNFPNTGELFEIELLKASLSKGQYGSLIENGTSASRYSRYIIDMISVFTIIFPELKKDMKVKTISELEAIDSKILLKIYVKEVLPWFDSWMEVLNHDDEE